MLAVPVAALMVVLVLIYRVEADVRTTDEVSCGGMTPARNCSSSTPC